MTESVAAKRSPFQAVVSHLFAASTVLFFIGGALIVLCQAAQLLLGHGMGAIDVAEAIGPYAFGTSSVAGILAFILTYFQKDSPSDGH